MRISQNKMPLKSMLLWACFSLALFAANSQANDWSLKDKDGVKYTLSGLQGKWVLVNFWAPWCPTCIQEMPDLMAVQTQNKDLQVIGVAVMYSSKQEVMNVIHSQAIFYPVVMGNEGIASNFGSMHGMPTSFLYSPDGKLLGHHDGPLTADEINKALTGDTAIFNP